MWESPKQPNPVVQADISSDGRLVAIASGVWGQDGAPSIEVWDIETNELKWRLEGHPPSEVCDVRFSPDGSYLLSAATVWQSSGKKGGTMLWDLASGQVRLHLSKSNAYVARFSRDGKTVFVGENEGWVKQYSIETGAEIQKYVCADLGRMILDLDFNPDGSRLLVASRDQKVTLWDTASGQLLQKISFTGDPRKLCWSPDGRAISLSHYSGLRSIFGIQNGRLKLHQEVKEGALVYGDFTPDGSQFVCSVFGDSVRVNDASTGYPLYSLPAHNGHTKCVGFDASGHRMVTGGGDNRVRVWDLVNDQQQPSRSVVWGAVVSDISFHPKTDEMAFALQKHPNNKHSIEIRDVHSHRLRKELIGHSDWPTCVAYSADGNQLISGSLDKSVRIWDASTGTELSVFDKHQRPLMEVAFLPNSLSAASIDTDGNVLIWNIGNRSIERSWQTDVKAVSVAFHPKQPWLAMASNGGEVAIWDVLQGIKRGSLPASTETSKVCFSPNGGRFATVADDTITQIWRTEDLFSGEPPRPLSELQGHSDTVSSISFSPDGRRLVSLSRDESVRLFDVDLGYELFRLESDKGSNGIVQFSVDGKSIVRTLPGNYSTWSVKKAISDAHDSKLSFKAWHESKAAIALKNNNYFAAEHHQSWLIRSDPGSLAHVRDRAESRLILGT